MATTKHKTYSQQVFGKAHYGFRGVRMGQGQNMDDPRFIRRAINVVADEYVMTTRPGARHRYIVDSLDINTVYVFGTKKFLSYGGRIAMADITSVDQTLLTLEQAVALFAPLSSTNWYSGSKTLASGADSGSVTGLALGFTPLRVVCSVVVPSSGEPAGISVMAVNGTLTTDGFDYELDGVPPDANHSFDFVIYG